ncbi:AmiS/UreI family transporter [Arthrobacter sp. TB 23]|uniref:AmiS/UreI family transporter n=1 Tax=Arthrobacter sp. TB 23 TaxID=494419 RepID=UPI000305A039|nr:AmiS/UreI family transporter [Arthrobacter sp. TB 23]
MNSVGLFYVGAVLFINGLMLLGKITPKSAGIFNVFVGGLQCIMPVLIITQSDGDPAVIHGTFAVLLFGFTYLYVGITNLAGISPEGIGWFSLFVAASAVYMGFDSFISGDLTFGVIWLAWAVLWTLFFLLLALGKSRLTIFSGWIVALWAVPTTSVPAVLLMRGAWEPGLAGALTALVVLGGLAVVSVILAKRPGPDEDQQPRPVNESSGKTA